MRTISPAFVSIPILLLWACFQLRALIHSIIFIVDVYQDGQQLQLGDWFAKNGRNMPGLHWHLCIFLERIFDLLADFSKNFTNINIVTIGRPISEFDTSSLTKALTVMKAFINQVELVQSTNAPIVIAGAAFINTTSTPCAQHEGLLPKRQTSV